MVGRSSWADIEAFGIKNQMWETARGTRREMKGSSPDSAGAAGTVGTDFLRGGLLLAHVPSRA